MSPSVYVFVGICALGDAAAHILYVLCMNLNVVYLHVCVLFALYYWIINVHPVVCVDKSFPSVHNDAVKPILPG